MWAGLMKSFKALKERTEDPREGELPPEGLGTQVAASPFLWVSAPAYLQILDLPSLRSHRPVT